MNTARFFSLCIVGGILIHPAAWSQEPDPYPSRLTDGKPARSGGAPESSRCGCCDCQIETIVKGEQSGLRWGEAGFLGSTGVIRSSESWWRFWVDHTGPFPDLPPPDVDFSRWNVLVVVQGVQSTSCGPSIRIAGAHRCGPDVLIRVVDDETPGPCDSLSNPFHLVRIPIRCLGPSSSIAFATYRPDTLPGAVGGRVLEATDSDVATPIGGAPVRLMLTDDRTHVIAETHTNREGFYRLHDVPAGTYVAVASAEGYAPTQEYVRVFPGEKTERNFILHPLEARKGDVAGHVLGGRGWDSAGPILGARVMLKEAPTTDSDVVSDGRVTETDCDGAFRFFNVPHGEYILIAEAKDFFPERVRILVVPAEVVEHRFLLRPR